jgi:C-terminal processing protease CtpA/Prc
MKKFILSSIVIAAVLTIVSAPHFRKNTPENTPSAPREQARAEEMKAEAVTLDRDAVPRQETAAQDNLTPAQVIAPAIENPTPPKAAATPPPDPALLRWDRMARKFEQQEQFARETDPAKRLNLIRAMSSYVRIDTLTAIDWAIGLQDPSELQVALEAINNKALVGIGAKIQVDETGFPRIRETTVMSAVGATGQVEPGDYIVGMNDGTGEPFYFEGLPAREIAQHLRGQAGSEIRLLIKRISDTENVPQTFDIPIRRSLIVVQPPF